METIQLKEKEIGIEEELQQIRDNMLGRLFVALDNLKNKSVLADVTNSFDNERYYKDFSWDLFETKSKNPVLKISVGNDFYSDEEDIEKYTFRLDDIMDIEVDDNLDEFEDIKDLDEPYYVENIIIILFNESQLKLELQW